MSKKNLKEKSTSFDSDFDFAPGVKEARRAIQIFIPFLYLLVSSAFYLRTYDSAQVKITLVQMGGITLIGLWLALIFFEGKKAFKKNDFIFLSPFLAYLFYIWISFFHAPYKGPSVDDFIRYTIYMSISLIVIREFDLKAIERLTKILIITAYIAIIYGVIQFFDTQFFPPRNQGSGLDPFIWRGAFGERIFSTYGNPNFFGNFLVLSFPILLSQYLKKRSIYLLPGIILNVFCIYFTYTKGAWLGFMISFILFISFYIYFFTNLNKKKILRTYILLFILGLFTLIGGVKYAKKSSSTSVPFRVATWLSTWEMIETHPFIGTGTGVFKIIYPAYRRPIIFHLEGKHNTETDHAENEHLEEIMDHGIIGAGLFYWIIVFVVFISLNALKFNTKNINEKKIEPIAYDILGYLTAFLGMLIHNFTDVSMRFVSSGVYLGLLPAVLVNLSRGYALWQLHYIENENKKENKKENKGLLLKIFQTLVIFVIVFFVYKLISQFSSLQGPMNSYGNSQENLQWLIAWSVFLLVVFYVAWQLIKIIIAGKNILSYLIILFMLYPIYYFWGWFKADVYHNMAIFYSKQARWDQAISYYEKVNKYNPYFVMPYYFMGNVFNDRFNMDKVYKPEWGDKKEIARTDFDRAMERYETLRAMAPNYVQMHHQVGNLYLKMFDYYKKQGNIEEAKKYLDKAMHRYDLYQNIDPVFAYNYYRRAQIWIIKAELEPLKRDYYLKKAEEEYLHYIDAWKCFVPGHKHESAEAYTNLGNLRYMMGRYKDAGEDFKKALKLDPNFVPAKNALEFLKRNFKI